MSEKNTNEAFLFIILIFLFGLMVYYGVVSTNRFVIIAISIISSILIIALIVFVSIAIRLYMLRKSVLKSTAIQSVQVEKDNVNVEKDLIAMRNELKNVEHYYISIY